MSAPAHGTSGLRAPADLTGYPTIAAAPASFRAHDDDLGPWYFRPDTAVAPEDGGRFDLPAPDGTCYVASAARVAVRERLGHDVERGWIHDTPRWQKTTVSILQSKDRPGPARPLANPTDPDADNFHNRELVGTVPYDMTREWANAFDEHGLGGVLYPGRWSNSSYALAEAWFGPAGPLDPAPPSTVIPRDQWEPLTGLRVIPAVADRYRVNRRDVAN